MNVSAVCRGARWEADGGAFYIDGRGATVPRKYLERRYGRRTMPMRAVVVSEKSAQMELAA